MSNAEIDQALHDLTRGDAGRVLAAVARRFGDLDLADEAVQLALIEAARVWPDQGIPRSPAAWLHQVARRKAIDMLRRAESSDRRLKAAAPEIVDQANDTALISGPTMLIDDRGFDPGDERLRLVLLCCHPALDIDAQAALTLRLVGGLTTEEIAAAFLVPTPTLAQRITRAKKKIRLAGIPMSLPDSLDDRIAAVRRVLYLTFNEGYLSRGAQRSQRVDLCDEAIRLTVVIAALAPDDAETRGLLALMRFGHARRDARITDDQLVLLDDQDRDLWHDDEIALANADLHAAMTQMTPGPYQLQAVIASHHTNATSSDTTDWSRIVALYDQLIAIQPSPIVELNRAVAVARLYGPDAGLDALDAAEQLDTYHLWHATRGELLRRSGRIDDARTAFDAAHDLAVNPVEVAHLAERLARL